MVGFWVQFEYRTSRSCRWIGRAVEDKGRSHSIEFGHVKFEVFFRLLGRNVWLHI